MPSSRAVLLSGLLFALPPRAWATVVVLDPGHGGSNTGAYGPSIRRYEKELTLDLSRRVERYLQQWRPDVEVVLTRDRDTYLTLTQRVRKANGARASLFVSIHFNASETRSLRGFETFILTRKAAAAEVGRLSMQARRRGKEVGTIVSDLLLTAVHGTSARFAARMQRELAVVRGAALDRGVRQAPFDVLLGLRMPAVLVEVGFIDHPDESAVLHRSSTLEALGAALASAISGQLSERDLRGPARGP